MLTPAAHVTPAPDDGEETSHAGDLFSPGRCEASLEGSTGQAQGSPAVPCGCRNRSGSSGRVRTGEATTPSGRVGVRARVVSAPWRVTTPSRALTHATRVSPRGTDSEGPGGSPQALLARSLWLSRAGRVACFSYLRCAVSYRASAGVTRRPPRTVWVGWRSRRVSLAQ
jgi:hypothetical protein